VRPGVNFDTLAALGCHAVAGVTSRRDLTIGYQQAISEGTGMVLTPSGHVITNNHVIEGATSITVTDVGNHRTYRAVVVGYDQGQDIAVLQLAAASGLKTVPLSTSEAGDSGGPLVGSAGQVIGMNTAASSQFQISSGAAQAFAIPASQAVPIAAAIAAGRASAAVHIGATAFLGVQVVWYPVLVPGNPASSGAGVAGITPGTPAAGAGLVPGDVIVSLGGHAVTSAMSLRSVMDTYHPGDTASLRWVGEAGQAHTAVIVLAAGPAG